MNIYDLMYYTLLNYYSKGYRFDGQSLPPVKAFCLVMVSFYGQLKFLTGLLQFVDDPYFTRPKGSTGIFFIMSLVLTVIVFYRKQRYLKVFDRLNADVFANGKRGKFLGWLFLFLTILMPFIFILIRNKVYFGHWV